ncbi:hypothetical protein, partial [Thiolapillus sp.]|uniref:hypothetical protein n=1 Tax=Thiolapillus sp. TaxID=2017437 RepID=UPI003AF9670E
GLELSPEQFGHARMSDPAIVAVPSILIAGGEKDISGRQQYQACLRPRDRFWDIPVPKIDSAFDNLLVPQPSWSPSTTQQLRKLVAAPYLAPNDWTPRSEAYFVFPLAQGTPGKQCGLAATGVYQPSLRSPWLAAFDAVLPGNADGGAFFVSAKESTLLHLVEGGVPG